MRDVELQTIVQLVVETFQSPSVRVAIEREVGRALKIQAVRPRRGHKSATTANRPAKRKRLMIEPRYPVDGNATAQEAADFLRITRYMVYELVKGGRLPKLNLGMSKVIIPWKALHDFATATKERVGTKQ